MPSSEKLFEPLNSMSKTVTPSMRWIRLCLVNLATHAMQPRKSYSCGGFYSWQAFSDWLSLHDSVAPRLLKYLVASATIYSIWSERNKRYHDNISSPPETIFKLLDRFIRDAILSKRNQRQSCGMMQHWLSRE